MKKSKAKGLSHIEKIKAMLNDCIYAPTPMYRLLKKRDKAARGGKK